MKKFMFPFLMTGFTLCLTTQVSYGMSSEVEEREQGLVSKKRRFSSTENSSIEVAMEGLFEFMIRTVYFEVITHSDQDQKTQKAEINKFRLLNHTLKRLVDFHTHTLDLSASWWCPRENRPQNNENLPLGAIGQTLFFIYKNDQLFVKSRENDNKPWNEGLCSIWNEGLWSLWKEDGKTYWNSKYISACDETGRPLFMVKGCHSMRGKNPFTVFFTEISRNLKDFVNLTSLNLKHNTAIQDDDLICLNNLTSLNLAENTTISGSSFRNLTKLKELDLTNNKTITDESLKSLTNLENLNLMNNDEITNKSVTCLLKLRDLNLATEIGYEYGSKVNLNTFYSYPNLQVLTLGIERKDTREFINIPSLTELRFRLNVNMETTMYDWEKMYQQAIYIADSFFLYLENDIDQSNHDTVSLLKEKYKSEIILPLTHYQLTSRLINENTSFRVTLQELQNFSIITDSLHSGDHDEEYSRKIHEIIKILREISKKDLKILRVYPGISEVHDLCDTKWAW